MRQVSLAVISAILTTVILLLIVFDSQIGVLTFWNVSVTEFRFLDMLFVEGAYEGTKAGLDISLENRFDPTNRPYVYPDIWIYIWKALQYIPSAVDVIATLQIFAIIWILLWLGGQYGCTWLAFVFIVSSPILLLFERGNVDGLIFILLIAAVFWLRGAASGIGYGVAAALKVFPLLGGLFVFGVRSVWVWIGIIATLPLIVWGLFDYLSFKDQVYQPDFFSFGVPVIGKFALKLTDNIPFPILDWIDADNIELIVKICAIIFWVVVAALITPRLAKRISWDQSSPSEQRAVNAFLMFGGLTVGITLIGYNFPYKFIFVAPAIFIICSTDFSPCKDKFYRTLLASCCVITLLSPSLIQFYQIGWMLFLIVQYLLAVLLTAPLIILLWRNIMDRRAELSRYISTAK